MVKFELFERSKEEYEIRLRTSNNTYQVYGFIKSKKDKEELALQLMNDLEDELKKDIYIIIK